MVRLSEPKAKSIADDTTKLLRKNHVPLKRFRSVLGLLQHAACIIPAAKGLFTPLNKATVGDPGQVGVGKSSEVRAALLDLRFIVLSLASCPTHHVSELVEYEPELASTCDNNNRDLFYVIALVPHQLPGKVDPRRWHYQQSRDNAAARMRR